MRSIFAVLLCLFLNLSATIAHSQGVTSVPPGGAHVFGPFTQNGQNAEIASIETLSVGQAFLTDGNNRLVYLAPTGIDELVNVTFSYTLVGEAAPRSLLVSIDPNFSAASNSVMDTALQWLFVLLIVALFIEAAVLFVVSLLRVLARVVGQSEKLENGSFVPSLFKPLFALVLSGAAVLVFGFDPLQDIVNAFNDDPASNNLSGMSGYVDTAITILLLSGGAESVRRVATGIMNGLKIPNAAAIDAEAIAADKRPAS